jgi:ferric-dicitrate binding protein FerR (iron transport regulator)
MHPIDNLHNKIIRLFSGEANPDEKHEIRVWLNQSPRNKKLFSDLREIWLSAGVRENIDNYDLNKAIEIFKQKIQPPIRKIFSQQLGNVLQYAAIFLIIVGLPVFYFLGKNNSMTEESYTTISCPYGDKSTINLPDGSIVYLNSGSKLTFNNNFHHQFRGVSIEGEGYFSVVENPKIPFIVKAADLEVKVLGTKFNVKAYPTENVISTTLEEGKIELGINNQRVLLKPGQRLDYYTLEKKMTFYDLVDITPDVEWKEGRLIFRNESLEELELKLERWFDVDIDFADEDVKQRRFTGIIERESILETLSYFNLSQHVGYRIKNNNITFYHKTINN